MFKSIAKFIILLGLVLIMLGCDEVILHDLDEVSANQVKVKLSQAGIKADKKRQGTMWGVSVASAKATEALGVLEDSRVLKKNLTHHVESSKSLILSKEERDHFVERELAWSLEQTLEAIPTVLEARVHLNLRNNKDLDPFAKSVEQTASVLLVCDRNCSADIIRVQKLIAGASGVTPKGIQVIISEANNLPAQVITNRIEETKTNKYMVKDLRGLIAVGIGLLLVSLVVKIQKNLKKRPKKLVVENKNSTTVAAEKQTTKLSPQSNFDSVELQEVF